MVKRSLVGFLLVGLMLGVALGRGAPARAQTNFGGATPTSADITNDGDVLAANDIELQGELYLNQDLYLQGSATAGFDTDQDIWFYDAGSRQENYLRWDDLRSDAACSGTLATASAFKWHLEDNTSSAFLFTQGPGEDIEMKLDDVGNLAIDGALIQSSSCDLAETFLGPDLEAGTVAVLDPRNPESVIASTEAYQATVVGVVSTSPGVLLNGPTAGFNEHVDEIKAVRAQLAVNPSDEGLAARKNELEAMRDGWERGHVPVALVGRVPVKVDGSYGAIHAGDALTTSPTPGHAMVLREAGPILGVALADYAGGAGTVLVLLKNGWYAPKSSELSKAASAERIEPLREELMAKLDGLAAENRALRQELANRVATVETVLERLTRLERAVLTSPFEPRIPTPITARAPEMP